MDLQLSEVQQAIGDTARRAAREFLAPDAAANDEAGRFPVENLKRLARLGLFGITISAEHGGSEAGPVGYVIAVRELAEACAATTVSLMVTNMVAETIERLGSDDQKRRFLRPLCAGEWAAAGFSLSEPGSGSDAAGMRATAVREGDTYRLDGTKAWVTSGGHAGFYLIMARTGGAREISAFLVPAETPGLTVSKPEAKLGLRASSTTQLILEGCRVPAANRLGAEGEGFKIAMVALDGGRIGVSAQAIGVGSAALKAATRYATERQQFGQPIARFQAIGWKLADMATELDAGWLLCLRAAWLKGEGRAHSQPAAMAKLFCSEAANRACHSAVQVFGGYGYTRDYPVERYLRDVRVTRIYEGTSEVQRLVIARNLLKGL